MVKIVVYGTPACPWCHKVQDFLKEKKIKFEYVDVSVDRKRAQEMVEKSGQMGVPVIDVDGKIIVGFDEDRLKDLLKIK